MDEIQIFKNEEFGEVRTLVVDNEPWFVLKDVCAAFGESNYRRVSARLDDDEKGVSQMDTPGGKQTMTIINESGVYSALFAMQPEKARGVTDDYICQRQAQLRKFKKWVTAEVLPAIRKTGGYMVAKKEDSPETIMARAILVAQDTLKRKNEQIASLQADVKKLAPDADYTQKVLTAKNTWTTNVVAKEFGMSAITLNKHLQRLGIQYKQHGVWLLSYKYQGKGYTKTRTYDYLNSNGETCSRMQAEWTETGRKWLHQLHDDRKF